MVVVITSTGIGGLRDALVVPGGFSVNPRRGEGTFRFALEDRGSGAIVADGWMSVDKTMRAFVPFDREHLPPPGRPGRVDARGLTGELTAVLGRVPGATRFGEERLTPAKGEELRASLARTALDAPRAEVRRAAALAYLSVPGDVAATPEARTLATTAFTVPPSDALWSLAGAEAFAHAAAVLDEPFSSSRAQAFVKDQPDVDAAGTYLGSAMVRARRTPDEQRAILASATGRLARFRDGLAAEDPDRKTAPGKRLPDFDVTTRDGKKVSSRSLAGRPWLLDFWSTTCRPCVRDAPYLEQAFATHARTGRPSPLGILSVTVDNADEVAAFRKDHAMPWQHALLDEGEATKLFAALGLRAAFPTYILVGADGTILDASPALVGSDLPGVLQQRLGAQ